MFGLAWNAPKQSKIAPVVGVKKDSTTLDAILNSKLRKEASTNYVFTPGYVGLEDKTLIRADVVGLIKKAKELGLRVDLSGKVLELADPKGKLLQGVNLDGLDLVKANLEQARMRGASLKGTDLTEANLTDADLWLASFKDAVLVHADLSGVKAKSALFNGKADLTDAIALGADFGGAHFNGANLSGIIMDDNTNMRAADTWGAKWDTSLVFVRTESSELSEIDPI